MVSSYISWLFFFVGTAALGANTDLAIHFGGSATVRPFADGQGRMWYRNIYPNIDAVFYDVPGGLEYDFVVRRRGDPGRIHITFPGARAIRLDATGDVQIDSSTRSFEHRRPVAYQDGLSGRRFVSCRYQMNGDGQLVVEVGAYDRRLPLIIDPVIKTLSYLGGGGTTRASRVTTDAAGYIYVAGITSWTMFPTTAPGTPLGTYTGVNGNTEGALGEVFVRKIEPVTGRVVYSVVFGTGQERIDPAIAVDSLGNAYVTGITEAQSFPTTITDEWSGGAPTFGPWRAYLVKLNPTGSSIVFSRLLDGSNNDYSQAIAVAPDGTVYITGATESSDYPTTPNAVQRRLTASSSAFLVRLSGDGKNLLYATYLGGTGGASGTGVAVDDEGDAYVTGSAGESFPTTQGSYVPVAASGAFVSKLDHASGQFVYSTYIPGAFDGDFETFGPLSIVVDGQHHAYLSGGAFSNFQTTAGAFQAQPVVAGYSLDAFVLELDAQGQNLVFSTRIGGTAYQDAVGIALSGDSVVIAGITTSTDFPVIDHSLPQCNLQSADDAFFAAGLDGTPFSMFLASFDHTGKMLTSATYGNCNADEPTSIAADTLGIVLTGTHNDQMFGTLSEIDMTVTAPIQIAHIADAASFKAGIVAPLEIVAIFGKGLGPEQGVAADANNGAFPTSLAGTQVFFQSTPIPILFASDTQVNAIIPSTAASQIAPTIYVKTQNGASAPMANETWMATPSIFTMSATGVGQASVLNQDYTINSSAHPADRGSVIAVYGTGGGRTQDDWPDGELVPLPDPLIAAPYTVAFVGGKLAKVRYAGAAPTLVTGAMQVNIEIPDDVEPGPSVPLQIEMSPFLSQTGVTIAVR